MTGAGLGGEGTRDTGRAGEKRGVGGRGKEGPVVGCMSKEAIRCLIRLFQSRLIILSKLDGVGPVDNRPSTD